MSPKRKRATSSQRSKGPTSGVRKSRKPTTRKNTQSRQAGPLAAALATNSSAPQASSKLSEPSHKLNTGPRTESQKRKHTNKNKDEHSPNLPRSAQRSTTAPATISQELVSVLQTPANKRRRDSEDKLPDKRHRQSVTKSDLSEENLKKLQTQLEQSKEMDTGVTAADRVRKRGATSQQPSFSEPNLETATPSVRSQKSASSLKFYRYHILQRARIHIHCEYPPFEIQGLLDAIFTRKISQERRREISDIAKETAQKFSSKTRGAHREDDLIEALNTAFDTMFPKELFNCPRKADWEPSLKPQILQENIWNLDALDQPNNERDDVVEPPNKRQQPDQSFPSPKTSQPTSQLPTPPSQPKQDGAVKNPRPDCTIGYQHATVVGALMKLGLSKLKADGLIRMLQREGKLFSDPTQDFLDVRFPIQVIEGKAYATGKTNFEAEDQAAVSGACMVNVQQQLDELYEIVSPDAKKL
ncbi:MAG: hypothetical protein Q9201_006430 [Fulgogasparrea decipioides]